MSGQQGSRGGRDDRSDLDALESRVRENPDLQSLVRIFLNHQSLDEQTRSFEKVLAVGLPVISAGETLRMDVPQAEEPTPTRESPTIERTKTGSEESTLPNDSLGPPFDETSLVVPDHFVNREAELHWLKERLRQRETVGVTALRGMGGIGKTSLAAKAALQLHDEGVFFDGIAVVVCQDITEPAEVLRSILTRFDPHRAAPRDPTLGERTLADLAQRTLTGKRALVILDNVEPGLDAWRVVRPLREAGVAVLITARQMLSSTVVPTGGSYELGLLLPDQALSVLLDAFRQGREIELSPAQVASAGRVVDLLGRHTLALRLAGAYAADVGRDLEALADMLEHDPARALSLPDAETPAVIALLFDQSVKALPESARRLYLALSAFGGDEFGRQAVLALDQALEREHPHSVSDRLNPVDLLVLRALLDTIVHATAPTTDDRERLSIHPLLRAFAKSRFEQEPDHERTREVAQRAIAQYYATYVREASLGALDEDQLNINAAIAGANERHEWSLVVDLCVHMVALWRDRWLTKYSRKYLPMAIHAMRELIDQQDPAANERTLADLRLAYARVLRRTEHLDEAEKLLSEDLTYRRLIGDLEGEANALRLLGDLRRARGSLGEAESYYDDSLKIFKALPGHQKDVGAVLGDLGRLAHARADYDNADRYFDESLAIAQQQGDEHGIGRVRSALGQVALSRGDMEHAEQHFTSALTLLHSIGDLYGESDARTGLGRLAIDRDDLARAKEYLQASLQIDEDILDRAGEGVDRSLLAQVELEEGNLDKAKRQFEENLKLREDVHDLRGKGVDLSFLGRIALEQGHLEEARARYEESIKLAEAVGNRRGVGASLNQLGVIAILSGDAASAENYLKQSLDIAKEEAHSETDIARVTLSMGRAAIVLYRSTKLGCRLIEEAIKLDEKLKRPLDLRRAREIARDLNCSGAEPRELVSTSNQRRLRWSPFGPRN